MSLPARKGSEPPCSPRVERDVRRAVSRLRWARGEYRSALVRAVDELEAEGCRDAYARVARFARVSRQSVREYVTRARAAG